MDLNKKIEQIIVDKGLSPSYFADAIGIQRSSISHILSGRNKPSLDIVQRILKVFPDIDRDWLLFDSDSLSQNIPQPHKQVISTQPIRPTQNRDIKPQESVKNSSPEQLYVQSSVNALQRRKTERPEVVEAPAPSGKQIERIVIFYTDGTFMESKPV